MDHLVATKNLTQLRFRPCIQLFDYSVIHCFRVLVTSYCLLKIHDIQISIIDTELLIVGKEFDEDFSETGTKVFYDIYDHGV